MGKMVKIDEAYRPSDEEPFMNERQREYYRRKLTNWKSEILREAQDTLVALQTESENHPDLADRASSETDRAIELRARDRQRKLIAKINAAIGRIDDGTYGYCEVTGEPISLRRLEARPIATMSIEAQEWHERTSGSIATTEARRLSLIHNERTKLPATTARTASAPPPSRRGHRPDRRDYGGRERNRPFSTDAGRRGFGFQPEWPTLCADPLEEATAMNWLRVMASSAFRSCSSRRLGAELPTRLAGPPEDAAPRP